MFLLKIKSNLRHVSRKFLKIMNGYSKLKIKAYQCIELMKRSDHLTIKHDVNNKHY